MEHPRHAGQTSSAAYVSATRPENSLNTSYGVARFPYTRRLAIRCTRSRTGWNPIATIAVARIDSARLGFPPLPTSAPIPTAMPTYTAVMNTASDAVHEGAADDDVDVVQPVLEDGDAGCSGKSHAEPQSEQRGGRP